MISALAICIFCNLAGLPGENTQVHEGVGRLEEEKERG